METTDPPEIQSDIASTLESEIDALSRIITDTRDTTQKSEDNEDGFNNDDITFSSLQYDSVKGTDSELPQFSDAKVEFNNPDERNTLLSQNVNEGDVQEEMQDSSKVVGNVQLKALQDDKYYESQTEECQNLAGASKSNDDIASKMIGDGNLLLPSTDCFSSDIMNVSSNQSLCSRSTSKVIKSVEENELKLPPNPAEIGQNQPDSLQVLAMAGDRNTIADGTSSTDNKHDSNPISESTRLESSKNPLNTLSMCIDSDIIVEYGTNSTVIESKDQEISCSQNSGLAATTETVINKPDTSQEFREIKSCEKQTGEHFHKSQTKSTDQSEEFQLINSEITDVIESVELVPSVESPSKTYNESESNVQYVASARDLISAKVESSRVSEDENVVSSGKCKKSDAADGSNQAQANEKGSIVPITHTLNIICDEELSKDSHGNGFADKNKLDKSNPEPTDTNAGFDDNKIEEISRISPSKELLTGSDIIVSDHRAHDTESATIESDGMNMEMKSEDAFTNAGDSPIFTQKNSPEETLFESSEMVESNTETTESLDIIMPTDQADVCEVREFDKNLLMVDEKKEEILTLEETVSNMQSNVETCSADSAIDRHEGVHTENQALDVEAHQSSTLSLEFITPNSAENIVRTMGDQNLSQESVEQVVSHRSSKDTPSPLEIPTENYEKDDALDDEVCINLNIPISSKIGQDDSEKVSDSCVLNMNLQDRTLNPQSSQQESSHTERNVSSIFSDSCKKDAYESGSLSAIPNNFQCTDGNFQDTKMPLVVDPSKSTTCRDHLPVNFDSQLQKESGDNVSKLEISNEYSKLTRIEQDTEPDLKQENSESSKPISDSSLPKQREQSDDRTNIEMTEIVTMESDAKNLEEHYSDSNPDQSETNCEANKLLALAEDEVSRNASETLKSTHSEYSTSLCEAIKSSSEKEENPKLMDQDLAVQKSNIFSTPAELYALPVTDHSSKDEEPIHHVDVIQQNPEKKSPKILQKPLTTHNDEPSKPPSKSVSSTLSVVDLNQEGMSNSSDSCHSPQRVDSLGESLNFEPINDIPKKDLVDKQQLLSEGENVGSPRIILKIAKSAITECSEPRSPKSPKIRSSADSPNPEDSPGHKLGKIKLKLSKGGHPSIISNDNYDETAQWHTDALSTHTSSGMKMKFTKTADNDESQISEDNKDKSGSRSDEPKKTETSIGMKIKLSKSGDASIVQNASREVIQDTCESKQLESPPIGVKIKLSKSGDASIIQKSCNLQSDADDYDEDADETKITFSKSSESSNLSDEELDWRKTVDLREIIHDPSRKPESPPGIRIKLPKTKGVNALTPAGETSMEEKKGDISSSEIVEPSGTGIETKIRSPKTHDSSACSDEAELLSEISKKTVELPIGVKIKLSKTGDPSIVLPHTSKEEDTGYVERSKHSKSKDHGSTSQKLKEDTHLEMKIKLSKNGHPTIITSSEHTVESPKVSTASIVQSLKHKDQAFSESILKTSKKMHTEETSKDVEARTAIDMFDLHNKRKEITIAPIDSKKSRGGSDHDQKLPAITIQPIMAQKKEDQAQEQKLMLESKRGSISQQQMNVINQEISITQITSSAKDEVSKGERLRSALSAHTDPTSSPLNSDCEIIDTQPELIIVNENSNSSQDVMIIDEVPPKVKVAKKRGRPRRNPSLLTHTIQSTIPENEALAFTPSFQSAEPQGDPLSIEQPSLHVIQQIQQQLHQQQQRQQSSPMTSGAEGSERPRRTCRSQKSYAPPKRGRGRGRGKRKNEATDIPTKRVCIDQDLTAIEAAATARINVEKTSANSGNNSVDSRELFKALSVTSSGTSVQHLREIDIIQMTHTGKSSRDEDGKASSRLRMPPKKVEEERADSAEEVMEIDVRTAPNSPSPDDSEPSVDSSTDRDTIRNSESFLKSSSEDLGARVGSSGQFIIKITSDGLDTSSEQALDPNEEMKDNQNQQNWLAPSARRMPSDRENLSSLTVIDEETRMSAESSSRSQTPARNMSVPGMTETLLNEESQGSVLSTATTESERIKVQKTRRMEIHVDPDEGPFTVEKIAEYEWPLDRGLGAGAPRGETFMIQEQISQYLGVKSFKRKYPDLKRRMVDMEERNYLRENGLVSESLCDMGLTAISSHEVLDIMCSDFPEQYEEYRRFIRDKVAKEHSKKQKELSAAANAERSRIDLAEMAMQSAQSWNAGFNKARRDARKFSLDLQTFTVQVPKRPLKPESAKRSHNYPVALIPGQYTDFFREYTPPELRYYPLNTVLYGPMRPNQRKFDSQSEGSQSDSDSDSSSDDSSSSSSEGTQDTEGSQSTMEEVDLELAIQSDVKCKICANHLNKNNRPEVLIQCGTCSGNVHPSCTDLTLDMVPHIRAYAWQCTDCKTCAQCHDPADEDKMLFCDMCDRGYHIYCVGLRRVPQGRWHCQECAICANCGSKEPGGANSDKNSLAQWQHEYKKGDKAIRVYVSTFCVPCSKLRGNQGDYN